MHKDREKKNVLYHTLTLLLVLLLIVLVSVEGNERYRKKQKGKTRKKKVNSHETVMRQRFESKERQNKRGAKAMSVVSRSLNY